MSEDFDLSRELQEFAVLSLGMGLDILKESGSLIPMVVSVKDNDSSLGVLATENMSVVKAAATYLATLTTEPERYAVLFNGKIGDGSNVVCAVIAHVGERGGRHGHTVFQAYDTETFSPLGQPEYAGQVDQLLSRQT
jgi:hypothetical protein